MNSKTKDGVNPYFAGAWSAFWPSFGLRHNPRHGQTNTHTYRIFCPRALWAVS